MEKQTHAAIIIQRTYKKYKQRKTETNNQINNNINEDWCASNDLEKLKLQAQQVLNDVTIFYKKLFLNSKKKEAIIKLNSNINDISSKLKTITRLEQCGELETSFSENYEEEAKKRHEAQLQQINLKWWEKLDIYEI